MNFKEFELVVKNACDEHGVQLVVGDKFVSDSDGNQSNGFFDDTQEVPILAYSAGLGANIVFPLLVHEYNHMQQYLEDSDIWKSANLSKEESDLLGYSGDQDVYNVLFDWIDLKIELDDSQLDDVIQRCIGVEFDCEKRTIQMIKDLDLEIDPDAYIQNALSYLYFYQYLKVSRSWYPTGNAPYQIESIYTKMPFNFEDIDVLKPMTDEWIQIYKDGFENCH